MELDSFKKAEKNKERSQETEENFIRQNRELKEENKLLRSKTVTSDCNRLLPDRPRLQHDVRRLRIPWEDNERPGEYTSIEVEIINADRGRYQLHRFFFSIISCFKSNVKPTYVGSYHA